MSAPTSGKRRGPLFRDVWPEYNNHGNDTGTYFGALIPRYAHVQVLLVDRATERIVARGRTIPFHWNGTLEDLPHGIDDVGGALWAMGDPPPLCPPWQPKSHRTCRAEG